jgi:hypothetical protein
LALGLDEEKRHAKKPFFLMKDQHKAPLSLWEPGPAQLGLYRDVEIPEPPTLFDDHSGLAGPAKKQEMTIEKHLSPFDLKLTFAKNLTKEQLAVFEGAYRAENEAFKKANLTGKDLVRWKYQRYIKDYLRCVAGVDDNLGRVLKYLDDEGLSKNTIVIVLVRSGILPRRPRLVRQTLDVRRIFADAVNRTLAGRRETRQRE